MPLFKLFLSSHQLLFLGPAFDTGMHRHHAAQLSVGIDGPLGIQEAEDKDWRCGRAFYVPPDTAHRLDAGSTPCAVLYFDPESLLCERACQRFGGCNISELTPPIDVLMQLASFYEGEAVPHRIADVSAALLGDEVPVSPRELDIRLQNILDWVDSNLAGEIRQPEAAAAVGVSESWLSHRFGEDIGVPLRRYVLWRRLRCAIEAALEGSTLTEAAHEAGFSDSAHLSRTFRESFGVAPSFLFGKRDRIAVSFLDP